MRRISAPASVLLATTLIPAAAAGQALPTEYPEIPGAERPAPERLVGGQPEPHHLAQAEDVGIRHVINLRGEGEFDAWEPGPLVEALGMTYHHVPVGGPDDLGPEPVEALHSALEEVGSEPALIYCASGNRVGALFALRAGWLQGKGVDEAVELGRQHGLAGLEDRVREILEG